MARAEGVISIATTRKRNKRAELLSLGADHVIVADEEDIVTCQGNHRRQRRARDPSLIHPWTPTACGCLKGLIPALRVEALGAPRIWRNIAVSFMAAGTPGGLSGRLPGI